MHMNAEALIEDTKKHGDHSSTMSAPKGRVQSMGLPLASQPTIPPTILPKTQNNAHARLLAGATGVVAQGGKMGSGVAVAVPHFPCSILGCRCIPHLLGLARAQHGVHLY